MNRIAQTTIPELLQMEGTISSYVTWSRTLFIVNHACGLKLCQRRLQVLNSLGVLSNDDVQIVVRSLRKEKRERKKEKAPRDLSDEATT